MIARIDHDGAAGAERVGMAGAIAGVGRDKPPHSASGAAKSDSNLASPESISSPEPKPRPILHGSRGRSAT